MAKVDVLGLLVTASLVLLAHAQSCQQPPKYNSCADIKGFTDVGGSCYAPIYVGGTQDQARAACKKLHPDADLATVRCETENKGIWDLSQAPLKDQCAKFNGNIYANQLIIGFSVNKWLSGASFAYRNWNSGEPNGNAADHNTPEAVTTIFITNLSPALPSGKWNDAGIQTPQCAAMCEVIVATSGKGCQGQGPCGPALPCFNNNNPVQSKCEDIKGFTNVGGSCYAPIYVGGSIAQAKDACKKLHPAADLATIRCDAENLGVYNLAQSKYKDQCSKYNGNDQYGNQLLIGISKGKWSSGSNTTYSNWNAGEPNGGDREPAGTLFFVNDSPQFPKLKWNDHADNQCAAMCEVVVQTSGQSCNMKPCVQSLPCVQHNDPILYDSCADAPGFTDVGGSCYAGVYVGGNVAAAKAACKKLNPVADLATVRCEAENTGVYNLGVAGFKDKCSKFSATNPWANQLMLGLRSNKWNSGANTTYRNWNAGEPNGGDREQIGTMYIVNQGNQPPAKWNDAGDDGQCAAMCEVIVKTSGQSCGVQQCPQPLVPPPCVPHNDPIAADTCAKISGGFTDVGGSCFKVIEISGDRDDARTACKKIHPNADLATIRCAAENKAIFGLISADTKKKCAATWPGNAYNGHLWIGLNDENIGDGVGWVNGANTVYRNWAPGEPNAQSEVYSIMYLTTNPSSNIFEQKWNDSPTSAVMCAAVCEVQVGTSGNGCGYSPCK